MPNSTTGKSIAWLFFVLGVLVLVFGGYGFVQYAIFKQRVDALRKSGAPISLSDLTHEVEDSSQDMAALMRPLVGIAEEFSLAIPGNAFSDETEYVSDAGLAAFEQQFSLHPGLFESLLQVSHAGDTSYSPTEQDVGPLVWNKVFQLLIWQANVEEFRGNPNAAAESYLAILRISKTNPKSSLIPCLLSQAGYIQAIDGMFGLVARNSVDQKITEEFSSILDQFDFRQGLESALQGERVFMIASLTDPPDADGDWSQQQRVLASIPGGPIGVYGNAILDDIERALAGLDLPLTDMDPDVESTSSAFGLYGNQYERWALVSRQKICEHQVYRQAFALLREIKTNCDLNEPSSVLEFVAALPDQKLLDPLVGERLIVSCESNRIRIYSPGNNRNDDGMSTGSDDVGLESSINVLNSRH